MPLILKPGEVVLVGGGPGDPGLITLAGMQALQQAEVIIHDRLGPISVLDELDHSPELVNVGKIPRGAQTPQDEINRLLVTHALAGRRVVRLKGGDSFVFGRGGEEWMACAHAGVPVRIIPGVSSAVSVPELAGIPVTHRSLVQGFTVVSGHVPPDDPSCQLDWDALARTRTTLVLLMAVKYLPQISERLQRAGMDPATPAAIIQEGSLPEQRCLHSTLSTVADDSCSHRVRPPAIVVLGQVAGLGLAEGRESQANASSTEPTTDSPAGTSGR